MTLVDLSHPIYTGMPKLPFLPEVQVSCLTRITEGAALNIGKYEIATHAGSHIDAPYHAFEDGKTIDQMPLETFVGPAAVIPFKLEPAQIITPDMLENSGVRVERGDMVFVHTGWDRYFGEDQYWMNPHLSKEACEWMVERGVKLVALDCVSPEMPLSLRPKDFAYPAHRTLLRADIPIIENLCNFGPISGRRVHVMALPLRLRGGDGGHARVVAGPLG